MPSSWIHCHLCEKNYNGHASFFLHLEQEHPGEDVVYRARERLAGLQATQDRLLQAIEDYKGYTMALAWPELPAVVRRMIEEKLEHWPYYRHGLEWTLEQSDRLAKDIEDAVTEIAELRTALAAR